MSAPTLITILTDFGTADGYVGSVKGVMKTMAPQAELIDISHDIKPFHIQHGAYALANYYDRFPSGTVHLAVIDPGVGGSRKPILIKTERFYFVGPDNGLFQMVLERSRYYEAYEINISALGRQAISSTFHARDIFAPTAARLALGDARDLYGPAINRPVVLPTDAGIEVRDNEIKVPILTVDRFGNIISVLRKSAFDELQGKAIKSVRFKNFATKRVNRYYTEKKTGEPMALWNSHDYFEVAVSQGNAARYFDVDEENDSIIITMEK